MFGIKRREFITLLGGAIASWPRTGRAQQRPKIGLLDTGLGTAFAVPFMGKLAELGYVDGENVVIERRSADGNPERLGDLAADLVRQKVDVIVTAGTPAGLPPRKLPAQSLSFLAPTVTRSASVWSRVSPGLAET